MGKKNKKFKKHINASSSTLVQGAPTMTSKIDQEASEIATKAYREDLVKMKVNEDEMLNEKYAFVRHDVKRLLISLAILFVVMIGFFYLNQKTETLNTLGNWIYKIGHFSI